MPDDDTNWGQQLEALKLCYGSGAAGRCESLLQKFRGVRLSGVQELVTAHDALLFLRAFPQSPKVAELADKLLAGLQSLAITLAASEDNAEILDDESVSGIAGTTVSNTWTFDLAVQLAARYGKDLGAEFDADEHYRQMGLALPSVLPLLEDDSFVEADTPFLNWIAAAASGSQADIVWLLQNFSKLSGPPILRTGLFSGMGINMSWNLKDSPASRTLARRPVKRLFCHTEPLLRRSQVSIAREMTSSPSPLRRLSNLEGRAIIDMAQDLVTVRYRELQGTTYGDPNTVLQADVGRGLQLFLWGLLPEWRLPLRGYYAGFALKNGVPINYFEAIGLFDWMEVGFNTFYAYREGETAWIYAQWLRLLHQVAGTTCISVYPYQIGQDNEEAIKSGAFWFYRKLGFRPRQPELLAIAMREEQKMARDPKHRTSKATLCKLAEGHMFFEFGEARVGLWDSFSTRTLGLAVQKKMAREYGGDARKIRRAAESQLSRVLGVKVAEWSAREQWAFSNFAVVLSLVDGIARWSAVEKLALVKIIRAKAGRDETKYFRLMQRHDTLREALVKIGSGPSA